MSWRDQTFPRCGEVRHRQRPWRQRHFWEGFYIVEAAVKGYPRILGLPAC